MLYERWRQIAQEHPDEIALRDVSRGVSWTFRQLVAEGEKPLKLGPVVFPQGTDFVLTLLRAWHSRRVVCPLEAGQKPLQFESLPPGCAHLKTTSATGGVARVVAFTEEQLAADADNIVATMGLRHDWPNLGVISIAHSYGFSNLALPLLLHGIPLILVDVPLPEMVRRAAESAEIVGSVCSGALILAAVGLLEGRQATTHWAVAKTLESYGATYHRARWVEDGKFIMSAGVSAGIDMGLQLAARLTDETTARAVQLSLDYDPQPPYGRLDYDEMSFYLRSRRFIASLLAPMMTAKPKRLTREERAADARA